jgi:hypothetical protein
MATFATHNADISRYACKSKYALWTQFFEMPIAFEIVALASLLLLRTKSFSARYLSLSAKLLFVQPQLTRNSYKDALFSFDGSLAQGYGSKPQAEYS